jgi:hypothetical protein
VKECPFHTKSERKEITDNPEKFSPFVICDTTDEGYGCYVQCPHCGARGPITGLEFDAIKYWNDRE